MIYEKSRNNIYKKIRKLNGFVNEKTIKKYIEKNKNIEIKKIKFNLNKLFTIFGLFCGTLLVYHLYTLWIDYKINGKKEEDISMVPLSGRY